METLTDNRNRTAGDLRHYFDKFGGNLGQTGSVSWQFQRKGLFVIEAEGVDEDALMEAALEAGADDFAGEGEAFEITCAPDDFGAVYDALEPGRVRLCFRAGGAHPRQLHQARRRDGQ